MADHTMPKRARSRTARIIAGFRPQIALLLAAVLLAIMYGLRPLRYDGLYADVFWVMKASWRSCADLVIGGDSRTTVGVSPAILGEHLPRLRIANYAFYGTGYSPAYLHTLRSVLNPASRRKLIVLGVTPLSLTAKTLRDNWFTTFHELPAHKKAFIRWLGDFPARFAPYSLRELASVVAPALDRSFLPVYFPDGWQASVPAFEDESASLADYRQIFVNNPVSPAIVDALLRFVAECSSQGIEVFGFRPPTTGQMVALENRAAGFDEAAFAAAFHEAGGSWITLEERAYRTFDGSHLGAQSAILLSKKLGRVIAASGPAEAQPAGREETPAAPVPAAYRQDKPEDR